jgi:glycosyltransferase involved in cell wall biosynthesis
VLATQLERGRHQLRQLRSRTILGLADSQYNEAELRRVGYESTDVLPIVLNEDAYDFAPNRKLVETYRDGRPNLLFVGRLVPHKCQGDLIKMMHYLKDILPDSHLFLVGSPSVSSYEEWLEDLAVDLGVNDQVLITGHVSQRDLVTYYLLADFYVSMSEHEGLGKPLVESMYFRVPIVAYAAAAVPETLGGTGVLVNRKELEVVAELIAFLWRDNCLCERLVSEQRNRVDMFLIENVKRSWLRFEKFIKATTLF